MAVKEKITIFSKCYHLSKDKQGRNRQGWRLHTDHTLALLFSAHSGNIFLTFSEKQQQQKK